MVIVRHILLFFVEGKNYCFVVVGGESDKRRTRLNQVYPSIRGETGIGELVRCCRL